MEGILPVSKAANNRGSKKVALLLFLRDKIQSVPAIAVYAFAGLLLGMCVYFGPLETYAPITNWYHTVVSNDFWRHLLFRAYPEAMFAAWFAQCVAMITVINGQIKKHYRIIHTHELFWRPIAGLLATIPGAATMAGILLLWNKFGIGSRVHSAAKAFCSAGSSGHCLSKNAVAVINSHPGVWGQFLQSTVEDGQKKLIVIAGSFVIGIMVMKPYFWNVQGWLAENRIIEVNAKNAARQSKGKSNIPYVRFYHHLIPGYRNRVMFIADNNQKIVLDSAGKSFEVSLHLQNHTAVNNHIYRAFKYVTAAGILGGLYIMFFIAQHQYLAIVVRH